MDLTPRETQLRDHIRAGSHTLARHIGAQMDAEAAQEQARLEQPGALLAAALWYATELGLPVIPCHNIEHGHCTCPKPDTCPKPAKHPRTPAGFHDATTDPDRIRAWWGRWPNANVAAPTGILFDVIDVDGPEGMAEILSWDDDEWPPILGKARTTRPGGWHFYVPPVPGEGRKPRLWPGVDYLGCDDNGAPLGYVLLPPSVGANGNRYRWTQPLTITAAESGAA